MLLVELIRREPRDHETKFLVYRKGIVEIESRKNLELLYFWDPTLFPGHHVLAVRVEVSAVVERRAFALKGVFADYIDCAP